MTERIIRGEVPVKAEVPGLCGTGASNPMRLPPMPDTSELFASA